MPSPTVQSGSVRPGSPNLWWLLLRRHRPALPLARFGEGFTPSRRGLGTRRYRRRSYGLVAHLSRWLAAKRLDGSAPTEPTAELYFAARRSAGYVDERTVRAVGPLIDYLRGVGAVPLSAAAGPVSATGQLLARHGPYLTVERGDRG